MKHKAKLKENDNWATGYYLQVEGGERHFLILSDAELADNDLVDCLVIHGWVEIDPDTLQPVRTFGDAIAAKRKNLGLSQEKLARKVTISRNYLSQIERNEAQNLSAAVLFGLGAALEIKEDKLIEMWRSGRGESEAEKTNA